MRSRKLILLMLLCFIQLSMSAEEILNGIYAGRILLLDGKGNIYVDYGSHSISKYSPKGELICKMGRKGEGPGDIKRLGGFAIHPKDNKIFVTEFYGGNKWISIFSSDGKFLDEWNCELDWGKIKAVSDIKFDSKGNVFLQTERSLFRRHKDFSIMAVERIVTKFSPEGKKLKEIYKMTSDFSASKGGKGEITIPFCNYLFWNIHEDKIFVRENTDGIIHIFDNDGNLLKDIPSPFPMQKVTKKDLDEWEDKLASIDWIKDGIAQGWFDLKFWRKNLPFPRYKPVSGSQLFFDSHGCLYSMKYHMKSTDWKKYAKIDLSNYSMSMVSSNPGEWLMLFWKDYAFILRKNSDSNYLVVKTNAEEFFKDDR